MRRRGLKLPPVLCMQLIKGRWRPGYSGADAFSGAFAVIGALANGVLNALLITVSPAYGRVALL